MQLPKIDVLRGVAILLVFIYHSLLGVFGPFELTHYPGGLLDFAHLSRTQLVLNLNPLALGHVGVELFLLISGFLIHWIFLKSGERFEPAKFYSKRFWRIYPPYLVALGVFVFLLGSGPRHSLLTHLTLTHNLFPSTFSAINPSFWSLALEAQLYVLYPLWLLLRRRLGLGRSVGVIAAVSLAGIAFDIARGQPHSGSLPSLWIVWVLGAYLAENFHHQRRLYTAWPGYLVLGYAGWVALKMTVAEAYFGDVLFSVLSMYALDWYLHQPARVGWLGRGLAVVGTYSYSIYLFHQPFLAPLVAALSHPFFPKGAWVSGIIGAFACFFGLAVLSYHLLELPAIALGARFYRKFLARD